MKSVITIILAAAVFTFGQSQVASLLNDARDDASFLASDFQNDCYTLKFGEADLTAETSVMTADEAMAMLRSSFAITTADGCEKAGEVESMELKFDYASGMSNTYPFDQISNLRTTPALSERLVNGVATITISEVRFTDASGTAHTLPSHVITVK